MSLRLPDDPRRSPRFQPPEGKADVRTTDVRTLIAASFTALGVALCFFLVYRFAAALFSFFIGITLGTAVKPAVTRLHARGLPRWVAALAVFMILGAILLGFVVLVMPVLLDQIAALLASAPRHLGRVRELMLDSSSEAVRGLGAKLPPAIAVTAPGTGALPVGQVVGYVGVFGRNLFTVMAVLLLGFYWTLEGDRRIRELALLVPLDRRRGLRTFIAAAEQKVGAYIRGQTLVCALVGVVAFGLYTLIGLPYAFMLGLTYAVLEAVPVLGPLLGTAAAGLVALSVRPSLVLWVIGIAVVVQLFENYVLIPRVMNRAVGVNPLVTLLAITGFGSVLGVAGAVLAIPMAAILQLLIDRFVLADEAPERVVRSRRDRLSVLRYEVRQVAVDARKLLRADLPARAPAGGMASAEKIEDAVEGIALDLERLLEQTVPAVERPR
jgi:predicted PurR-regulated permease PerM